MSTLKFKNADGTWNGIAAFKGEPGKDGAIQYQAGFGINISEDNVISSTLDPNDDLTVDLVPTEGSKNPVSSGGVFDALGSIDPNIQFTEMPDPNTFDPNKVIQYVGETNEQFTKGHWYKVGSGEIKEKLVISQGEGHLTGIIPTNHKVECCVEWTRYINENHAFGTYNPSNGMLAAQSMHFTTYSNKYYWGVDGTVEHNGGSFATGVHTIVFNEDDGNGGYQVTLNGEVIDNVKTSGTTQIVLFGRGGTVNFSGYFYHFKIWDLDTGELLAHYVPCYKKGVQGLYDLVADEMVKVCNGMVCEGDTVDYIKYWEQVDTQPAPITWPEYDCPIAIVTCRLIDNVSEPRYITSSEPAGAAILEKCTEMLTNGITLFLLRILTPDQQHIGYLDVLIGFDGYTVGINTFELPKFFSTYQYLMPSIESYMSISNGKVVANNSGYVLRIRNWMIDRYYEIAPKSALSSYALLSNVLVKNNTTSYTPTSNYHPATKKYVDDTVSSGIAGIPGPDLSNYPTLDQVLTKGNTEEYTPELDYEPATKKYVDATISDIEIPEGDTNDLFTIKFPTTNSIPGGYTVPQTEYEKISNIINKVKNNDIAFTIHVCSNNTNAGSDVMFFFNIDVTTRPTKLTGKGSSWGNNGYSNAVPYYGNVLFNIRGTWEEDVFVVTQANITSSGSYFSLLTSRTALSTTNTTSFTPTADYHPATKKYVDDAIAASSGSGGITEETDPVFTGHIASTITEDDITNWNNKADSGGIDEESDPTVPVWVKGITENDILNWNNKADSSAISGVVDGILANKGYITEETEPAFNASVAADITQEDIDYWNAKQNALVISDKYNGAANPVATIADIPTDYITQVNASDISKDNYIMMNSNNATLSKPYNQLNNMLVNNGVIDYKQLLTNFDLYVVESSTYNGEAYTNYSVLQGDVYSVSHSESAVYNSAGYTGSTISGVDGDYDTVITFKPYYSKPAAYSSYYELRCHEYILFVNSANILSGTEGNYALRRAITTVKYMRYTG